MFSWFRRNGGMVLAIAVVIVVFGPMFLTIANVAPNYEPSAPAIAQAKTAQPFANVSSIETKPLKQATTFTVAATSCNVQFPGVTTSSERGICSVTINRTMYPYVAGSGTSCLGIDLTWADNYLPEKARWVIRLRGENTSFTFAPYTLARLNAELRPGPAPVFEFSGKVKDQYGEGTVSCGMLPAK